MYTRCPECETTFKLGVTDLRRAQGKVRCGDCDFVFNAIEFLAEEAEKTSHDELPVLKTPAGTPSTDPAASALASKNLEVANDSSLEDSPEQPETEPATDSPAEAANPEDADEDSAEQDWSPVESSDDWLKGAGVIIGSGKIEPTLSVSGLEELPTAVHEQPPVENNNLPTVTMETLAPDFEQNPTNESTDQEEAEQDQVNFAEEDADANTPVVDLPTNTEFQEEPFVDTGTEESWSDLSGKTLDNAETDEPASMPYGKMTDEGVSAEEFLAEENVPAADIGDEDTTSEPTYEDTHPAMDSFAGETVEAIGSDESAAEPETTEEAADFDDSIWEKIPGVGASDEDWESLKSGSHQALSDEDKLADGLSYTSTELKLVSTNEPVEDYLGGLQAEDEPEVAQEDSPEADYPEPELSFSEDAATTIPDIELPESLEDYREVFDIQLEAADAEAASESPENSAAVEAALPEVFSQAEMPEDDASAEEAPEDTDEFASKWVSFFGTEPKPEELTGESEQLDEEETDADEPVTEADEIHDSALEPVAEVEFTTDAESEPEPVAAEPDSNQDNLDIAEAAQKLDGTFGAAEETDFSEFDELNESQEPEQQESAESLIAEISVAFDDEETPQENVADMPSPGIDEETEAPADNAQSDADPLSIFKREFDPHTDTWTGLEEVEDVVMSTGIFDADFIEEIRQKAAADDDTDSEETAEDQTEEQQPPAADTEATATPGAPPVWESEYAKIDTEPEKQSSRGWLWGSLLLILAVCFPAQLIHYNRDSLATHPAWGDSIRGVYGALNLPLYPQWSLDSYEIRGHEAIAGESGEDVLDIRTEIAVIGDTAMGVPYLRVILRDRWANPLAASNFAPTEYTNPDNLPADGLLQPNQTIPAFVSIVDPGTGAQGYELEVCLPRRNEGLICTDQPFK